MLVRQAAGHSTFQADGSSNGAAMDGCPVHIPIPTGKWGAWLPCASVDPISQAGLLLQSGHPLTGRCHRTLPGCPQQLPDTYSGGKRAGIDLVGNTGWQLETKYSTTMTLDSSPT